MALVGWGGSGGNWNNGQTFRCESDSGRYRECRKPYRGTAHLVRQPCHVDADRGQRRIKPGTNIVFLEQDPDFSSAASLMDWALGGPDAPEAHEVEAIAGQLGIDMSRPAATAC